MQNDGIILAPWQQTEPEAASEFVIFNSSKYTNKLQKTFYFAR